MEFKKVKLQDIVTILGDGIHGTPKYTENGEYYFINGNNLANGKIIIKSDTKTVDYEEYKKYKKDLNDRTLLVSINGTLGNVAVYNGEKCILGKSACYFNIKENVDKQYIQYILYSKEFQKYIQDYATGTTIKNMSLKAMREYEFILPEIEVQNKITKILSGIDKKIELNNQINDNLLELINNLYKESFSNIEEYKQADEIANITIGKTPPRSKRECFTYNEDDIKWLSISDLGKCGMYAWNTSEKLTEDAVNKYNVKVIPENTIVLSFKLTIGRIAITANKMATNEAIAHFNLIDNDMIYYLYSYLKNFDYSKLGNTSSIATAVNSKIIKAMPIGVPDKTMILEFNNKVKPLFEKIKLNEAQNETLTQLRDTLLPRLMNGEIDLEKIEI